jgi:hypothetical protein
MTFGLQINGPSGEIILSPTDRLSRCIATLSVYHSGNNASTAFSGADPAKHFIVAESLSDGWIAWGWVTAGVINTFSYTYPITLTVKVFEI